MSFRFARREGWLTVLAYVLVLSAVYSNVVFFGESLAYSDNFNLHSFWIKAETHGPHAHPATTWSERNLISTPNLQDPAATVTQWEPSGTFFLRSLRRWELPFWDPYTGGGIPAMANITPAFFFPPYALLVALGNGVLLKSCYFLALLLMAAWCTWALLRSAGLSWLGSFIGGLTFMLSGGLTQTVGSFIGQTACCLPVALLATRWFLQQPTWRATALLALVYAAIALASFPPLLVAIFALSAAYAGIELLCDVTAPPASRIRTAAQFAAGCLLAGALVAFYFLPVASLMAGTPQVAAFYRNASFHTEVRGGDLLQLLAPALLGGTPVWASDPVPRHSAGGFHYLGITALVLAALIDVRSLRRSLWLTAGLAAITTVGVMLGIPPFVYARDLPILHNVHFGNYYGIVLDFLLALVAAAGFERLRTARVSGIRVWIAVSIIVFAVGATLFTAIGMQVPDHLAYGYWRSRYLVAVVIAFVSATLVFIAATAGERTRYATIVCWAIAAALVIEGGWNAKFPRQVRWDAWDHPPAYIQYLQREAGLGRVYTVGGVLYANGGSAFGIIQLDSMMTFNPPRMFDLYRRHAKGPNPLFLRDADLAPEPVLDAANITYVAVPSFKLDILAEMKRRGHEAVFFDGYVTIFRRACPPRYFFTTEYSVASPTTALDAMARARPVREIILERTPPFASRPNQSDVPVTVEHFSNNRVRLSLSPPHPGFVYVSDAFFPGWGAAVNGQETRIQPANYAFKAVAVPAGPVTIELVYTPPGLQAGLGVSGVALLALAGLFGSGRFASWRGLRRTQQLAGREREQDRTRDAVRLEPK